MAGRHTWPLVVNVEERQLHLPFDSQRTVAELTVEIERRCQRQLVASIIGRKVLRLHGRSPVAPKLKGTHRLCDAIAESEPIFVVLSPAVTSTGNSPSPVSASRTTITPLAEPAVQRPSRPRSVSSLRGSAGGGASRTGGSRSTTAVDMLYPSAGSSAAVRPHSAGRRTAGQARALGGSASAASLPQAANQHNELDRYQPSPAARGTRVGEEHELDGTQLSVTQLIELEERAKRRAAEEGSRQAWADADERRTGDKHSASEPQFGAEAEDARAHGLEAQVPIASPRSSTASPVPHGESPEQPASEDVHVATMRKRRELDEEVRTARRKALKRFPSSSKVVPPAAPRSANTTVELAARSRQLSKGERFLHRLLREANATSVGATSSHQIASTPVPTWKEKLLDRAKVTALAPGRAVPKLYRSVAVAQLDAKPARPASAGSVRPGSAAFGFGGASSASRQTLSSSKADLSHTGLSASSSARTHLGHSETTKLLALQVGRTPFSASATKYLAQAVRDLEGAVGGGADGDGARGQELTRSRTEGGELEAPAGSSESRAIGSPLKKSHSGPIAHTSRSPALSAKQDMASAERRLFYYADACAKQELDAYYLREKEERLKAQVGEQEAREAAVVDSRFAHVEDSGNNLSAAAQGMHKVSVPAPMALCVERLRSWSCARVLVAVPVSLGVAV
jgi:hypothetical protein